jgi:IS30 family transposase
MTRRRRRIGGVLRGEVVRLAARGFTYREILERVDTSMGAIMLVLRDWGGVSRSDRSWELSPARLSLEDRIEIRVGWRAASRIGRLRVVWVGRPRRYVGK